MNSLICGLRLGFATNSSSSHSIVLHDKSAKGLSSDVQNSWGWEDFQLASNKEKRRYICAQICQTLGEEVAQRLCPKEYKTVIKKQKDYYGGAIDHQSVMSIPDEMYAKKLLEFVEQDRIVIHGGNDNTEDMPVFEGIRLNIFDKYFSNFDLKSCVVRYDEQYKFWTIYNPKTGDKCRLNFEFDETGNKIIPAKSSIPELVDLTITDYCEKGCRYCYRKCNKDGKHASIENVKEIIDALAELGTMEIALGGGATELHPQFWEIVQYCRDKNIVPNFTTADYRFVAELTEEQIKLVGGVGLTLPRYALDYNLLHAIFKNKEWKNDGSQLHEKLSLHYVCGIEEDPRVPHLRDLLQFAEVASLTVLLLGHKGDSKKFDHDYVKILCDTKESGWSLPSISVDSAFVAQYPAIKDAAESTLYLTDIREGSFSCYIDAVKMNIAPDSYNGNFKKLDQVDAINIKDIFQTF
jgi:hypothetical protein